MGNKDTITKKYLEQPEVFADAFNYLLFDGQKVIKSKDLKEQDPTELAVMRKMEKAFTNQKMRDVLRLCTVRCSKYANSDDINKLRDIMESREEYKSVDVQTVDIINTYTALRISKKKTEDGHMDMCAGMKGLIEEGRTEGRREGRTEGRREGENMLAELIKLLKPGSKDYEKAINGTSVERKRLYKKYKIID